MEYSKSLEIALIMLDKIMEDMPESVIKKHFLYAETIYNQQMKEKIRKARKKLKKMGYKPYIEFLSAKEIILPIYKMKGGVKK